MTLEAPRRGLTVVRHKPRVGQVRIERRKRMVAPLFAYLADRGVNARVVMNRVAQRHGLFVNKSRCAALRAGLMFLPDWMIPEVCAEFWREVVEVMGMAWMVEFGDELPDGAESEVTSRAS